MMSFNYVQPSSITEALDLLAAHGDNAKLLAGGTGLINLMKLDLARPELLISLGSLASLAGISERGRLHIGALTTLRTLETSEFLRRHAPLLSEACSHVATMRIRNMATLGGAVAHADPHMDAPPALIALDASIVAVSKRGSREIPADGFFKGFFETDLAADELVTEIIIPEQPAGHGSVYLKFLPSSHDDYATISVASRMALDQNGKIAGLRVAVGAAALTPVRARKVEAALLGVAPSEKAFRDAALLVVDEIEPLSDLRGSAEYKRSMAVVHVFRGLTEAAKRITPDMSSE